MKDKRILIIILSAIILVLGISTLKNYTHAEDDILLIDEILTLLNDTNKIKISVLDNKEYVLKSTIENQAEIKNILELFQSAHIPDETTNQYILPKYKIELLDKNEKLISELNFFPGLVVNIEEESYQLINIDFSSLEDIIKNT